MIHYLTDKLEVIGVSSSSKLDKHGPEMLIDGKPRKYFSSDEKERNEAWVQLKLLHSSTVKKVALTDIKYGGLNKQGKDQYRLRNLAIRVGDIEASVERVKRNTDEQGSFSRNYLCGTYEGPSSPGEKILIYCNKRSIGQYVIIHTINAEKTLMIGEVEIIGFEEPFGKIHDHKGYKY